MSEPLHTAESDAARLTDEQVDELVRLTDAIAAEEPYALDALVGTVESWIDATRVTPPAAPRDRAPQNYAEQRALLEDSLRDIPPVVGRDRDEATDV